MDEFGLGGGAAQDKEVEPTKALFRDKKLTRLWEKVLACLFLALHITNDLSRCQKIISIISGGKEWAE